jgi:hypothetical protein
MSVLVSSHEKRLDRHTDCTWRSLQMCFLLSEKLMRRNPPPRTRTMFRGSRSLCTIPMPGRFFTKPYICSLAIVYCQDKTIIFICLPVLTGLKYLIHPNQSFPPGSSLYCHLWRGSWSCYRLGIISCDFSVDAESCYGLASGARAQAIVSTWE